MTIHVFTNTDPQALGAEVNGFIGRMKAKAFGHPSAPRQFDVQYQAASNGLYVEHSAMVLVS